LEELRQQRRQLQADAAEPPAVTTAVVHQQAGTDGSVQQLLHTSQELSKKTMQLQQGMQRQQSRSSRLASPGQQPLRVSADDSYTQAGSHAACVHQPLQSADGLDAELATAQLPEQHTPAAAAAGGVGAAARTGIGFADSEDEDDGSSPDASVVKQRLRFGSASPAASLAGRLSDASSTPVAQGPTPDAVTPEASTPDMFAAARAAASCFKGGSSSAEEESPLLWGAAAASRTQSSSGDKHHGQQGDFCEQGVSSSTALAGGSPTWGADAAAAPAAANDAIMQAVRKGTSAAASPARGQAAAVNGNSSDQPQLSSSDRQRLQLLESVVRVMGGLYARGWVLRQLSL
jgi:hypothetical protein